jgi:hypothetical protein
MKHLKHTLETCVYSHSNICNIEIYFCNIQKKICNMSLKHVKHLKHAYRAIVTLTYGTSR